MTTSPVPSITDDDEVAVPRGLLGAAGYAIANKADAPRTLEKIREYAMKPGIAADQPAAEQPDTVKVPRELLERTLDRVMHREELYKVVNELRALLAGGEA